MAGHDCRGDETELAVALAPVRAGRKLLRPLSSATRYDLLIDNEDGTYTRIQSKTGSIHDSCLRFRAYSVSGHNTTGKRYHGQIDVFGVYCPETGRTYLVPIAALTAGATIVSLRLAPARNGQKRGIRLARPFELNPQAPTLGLDLLPTAPTR